MNRPQPPKPPQSRKTQNAPPGRIKKPPSSIPQAQISDLPDLKAIEEEELAAKKALE